MIINFYVNNSDKKVFDKKIQQQYSADFNILEKSSIVTPLITTKNVPNIFTCNYAYIPQFKRYYYINDIEIINKEIAQLTLTVDPLMSFKTAIKNNVGIIKRQEYLFNLYLPDNELMTQMPVMTQHLNFSGELNYNPTFVMNVAGGGE